MTFLRVLALALIIGVCTALLGWWSVPVVCALYALIRRSAAAPGEAALGTLVAWVALLARVAVLPAFAPLLKALGGVFPVPGFVLAIVALAFAIGLAWSASRIITVLMVSRAKPA